MVVVRRRSLDELTVAYFLEWPMPFEYAKAMGTYEKELGIKINWRAVDTGTAMSAAMASGDEQLAVSQGVPPFVVATSAGQDLQIVDVAVSYADNDNCVARTDLETTKDNAKELEGKKVVLPVGTAAHFGFLRQMEHFGIDISTMGRAGRSGARECFNRTQTRRAFVGPRAVRLRQDHIVEHSCRVLGPN